MKTIIILAAVILTGCANYKLTDEAGKPTDFGNVFNQCMSDADAATAKAAKDGIDMRLNKGLLVRHCMASNGYAPM
jgi:hypothetical protein